MATKQCLNKVSIIGAGAAGLCAARLLQSVRPAPEIVVYEQTSTIGGVWVYSDEADTEDNGCVSWGRMYQNMRTNLPKEVMPFPGFPFNADLPSFPHHSDVLEYLRDFTSHFDLKQYIQFRRKVVDVSPVEEGNPWTKWLVVTEAVMDGEETGAEREGRKENCKERNSCQVVGRTEAVYDAVLVCSGHYYKPKLSTVPDLSSFRGEVSHSYSYRDPASFRGQDVLVVGVGPSGRDIVLDVATEAKHVYLSYSRKPVASALPPNVTQVPKMYRVTSEGIELIDGSVLSVDSILLCTGYEYSFPFLSSKCGITLKDNRICKLYKHTFNTVHPSMAFIGVYMAVLPWPLFNQQTEWILSVWLSDKTLPSCEEMADDSDQDYQERLSSGLTPSQAHYMGPLQWKFRDEIISLAGQDPAPQWMEDLYDTVGVDRLRNLMMYKDKNYVIENGKWKEKS